MNKTEISREIDIVNLFRVDPETTWFLYLAEVENQFVINNSENKVVTFDVNVTMVHQHSSFPGATSKLKRRLTYTYDHMRSRRLEEYLLETTALFHHQDSAMDIFNSPLMMKLKLLKTRGLNICTPPAITDLINCLQEQENISAPNDPVNQCMCQNTREELVELVSIIKSF